MKYIRIALLFVVLAAVVGVAMWWKQSPEYSRVRMEPAKIADITPMVRLCTVDFYEDIPIKANIGPRHFFGKMTLTGSIGFDLETMRQEMRGDTIVVWLPREAIDIEESTAPGSYRVIDTWNERLLGKSGFTTVEENEIKRKVIESYRKKLYASGAVAKARSEAVASLKPMIESVTRHPVVVIDR